MPPRVCLALAERGHEERPVLLDLLGLLAKDACDLLEDRRRRMDGRSGRRREVGAAPDRLAVGGEEHGERPAALFAEGVKSVHVDLVDVGPLLAVDLDVDEQPVHHGRRRVVLEALVGHDMAPVAGGIADREQDRLVLAAGLGKSVRAPGAPVHRVVLVLEEVGAGFVAEQVFGHRSAECREAAAMGTGMRRRRSLPCRAGRCPRGSRWSG